MGVRRVLCRTAVAPLLAALVTLAGCMAPSRPAATPSPTPIATARPAPTASAARIASTSSAPARLPAAQPTATAAALRPPYPTPSQAARLVIPAIGVDAGVVPVGVTAEGEVQSPDRGDVVGWYNLSPLPGARGNSVLVGHVDWRGRQAVFSRLRELQPGDVVGFRDGNLEIAFKVEWVQPFLARAAPIDTIFASTREGKVTLITCEGTFDPNTRDYDQRLVVRATLAGG